LQKYKFKIINLVADYNTFCMIKFLEQNFNKNFFIH